MKLIIVLCLIILWHAAVNLTHVHAQLQPLYNISTIVGGGSVVGDGLPANIALLNGPNGVSVSSTGEIYIADTVNNRIRIIFNNGTISTIAGTGVPGYNGDGGLAINAQLNNPRGIAVSPAGEIYIADTVNNRIRIIFNNGTISTIAGTGNVGNAGDDGLAVNANLFHPSALSISTTGEIYIADTSNDAIRKISGNGIISKVATGYVFGEPKGVAVSATGEVFVAETSNSKISKISNGIISTIAGTGEDGFSGDGGLAIDALLSNPSGLYVSTSGEIYFADSSNYRIRKIATNGTISTIGGKGFSSGPSGDGGLAINANLLYPSSLSISATGEIYISQNEDSKIRKIAVNGTISTIAGGASSFGNNIPATLASTSVTSTYVGNNKITLSDSSGQIRQVDLSTNLISTIIGKVGNTIILQFISNPLCVKYHNNDLYILSDKNYLDKLISSTLSRVAGDGHISGFRGDGGLVSNAKFNYPQGIVLSSSGEIYIADTDNHRIRNIATSGIVSTIAGIGSGSYSGDGGLANSASISGPQWIAIGSNAIYIADTNNHRIRKVFNNGTITTIAGTGVGGYNGDGGLAINARLYFPQAVALSSTGEIYISDYFHRIRKVFNNGTISTIAGTGVGGYNGDGGLAINAQLNNPQGLSIGATGEIYFADTNNHRIRKIFNNGTILTIAGTGVGGYNGDSILARNAQLYLPYSVTISSNGEIYISDTYNYRIRKIATNGIISTVAGIGTEGYSGDGESATNAQLFYPKGVAVDLFGQIYISDTYNHRIRKVSSGGIISTVSFELGDGMSAPSAYISASSFEISSNGEIYIADTNNHRIRKVSNNGIISTIAGTGVGGYNGDGDSATKSILNNPQEVAISTSGEIYIADTYNHRIRKVAINGTISTIAGTGISGFSGDGGLATDAQLNNPQGVSISESGEIYIAESNSSRIRKISRNGIISTIAGTGINGFSGDGGLATNAQLNNPQGVAISSSGGELYITDTSNERIRKLTPWCIENTIFINGICEYQCFGYTNKDFAVCSGKGTCIASNNCSCTDSYFGDNCDQYNCYGVHFLNNTVCSGKGACSSPNNCTCESGYYGSNCEMYNCDGISKNDSKVCSGHGTCVSHNNCTCDEGYYDDKCSSFNCVGEKYIGQSLCQNNGSCTRPGNCECPYQFGGARCEYFKCYSLAANEPLVCGGHGTCLSYNNCSCSQNWFGEDCTVTTCFNKTSNSSSVCGGRGNCTDLDRCTCNSGFTGSECEHIVCYDKIESDRMVCSGNGKCSSPNNCTCESGYVGNSCQYHEIYLNTASAVIDSFHESLMKMLPNGSEIFSCNDIFDESEIVKFGENSSILCQWKRDLFQIYLGFDYSIQHDSIIQTKFNFSMRVKSLTSDVSSAVCTFGYLLTESSPLLDVVIRLNCDENLRGFKKVSSRWTCSQCSGAFSSLLDSYTNRTVVNIPISYFNSLNTVQGYRRINLQAYYSSPFTSEKSTNREVKVQSYSKSLPPSYYWLSDNYEGNTYSCVGHNCILESSLNSLNSSISYSFSGFFSLLNNNLYSKQMVRMINEYSGGVLDSEFNSNMQVFGVQLRTYVFLPYSIDSFKYSTFTNLDFVMTGINRTYPISSEQISIGLTIDDPYISKYTLSDYMSYSWNCFKVSPFNRTHNLTDNLCSSTKSSLQEADIKQLLSSKEGSYLIYAFIFSEKYFTTTVYKYEGYIELLDISNQSPKITTDYVPTITPSHKNIYLRNVVKSSSKIVFKWSLKHGSLKVDNNIEEFLQSNTIYRPIFENDIEIILNIDNKYLVEGEVYEFELSTKNSIGLANISISTRIDYKPRLSCSVENLKNENNFTSFETLISINCVKLPYESISSFVMEFHSKKERIGVISNTPKKALITKLPFSEDGIVTLVVKLQNLYGSIGTFKTNIPVVIPNYLLNDNSIRSRFDYISTQFTILKNSQPLKMEISNEINSLLTLLIQNETLSKLSDNILKELNPSQLLSFNSLLFDMFKITKSIRDITYKVDERVIQLTLPIIYKICTILKTTYDVSSLSTFSAELENVLEYIYSGMQKALNYYPTFIYTELLDNNQLEAVLSLQNILSNIYQNNLDEQYKFHKYSLEYARLTGIRNNNNSSFVEDIEYSNLLNDKLISLANSDFKVDVRLPFDFSNQISLNSKSKLFYSIKSFNPQNPNALLLQNKPIIDLSLLDSSYNIITVKNINPPIIFKFQGLITTNKTGINTTCVFYDETTKKWSTSGLDSVTIINKRTDEYVHFDMECRTNHLSIFSIEEYTYNSPIIVPISSNNGGESSNVLTIVLATLLPISLLILVLIIILVVFIVLLYRNKQKNAKEFANINTNHIELEGFSNLDFPSEGSMFFQPLMSFSSNGTTSEAFNPLSRYSDLVRIGQGSFGSVFKAFDTKTSSVKAIKVIRYSSMEELNNFMKEGTQLMNVNHPYILRVNEFFISKDQLLCIDMDFYELGDLVKLTNVDFDCSEKMIKKIMYQMCQALDYIHCNMKIIHRDIKPSNVFVKSLENDNIHIIVADFGLAKSTVGSANNSYAGTPIFMSPELGLGGKYYYNTDIYSLGVTIYQIMTKDTFTSISQLYLGKDQKEVTDLLHKKLQDSGQYSPKLVELVLLMLTKDNLIRPQAQDILEDTYFNDLKKKQ